MKVYPTFCNNIILPLSDMVLGTDVKRRLDRYSQFQWAPRAEIDNYKNIRLNKLLNTASTKVPFYADFFKQNNLSLKDFSGVGDLNKLPVIDKSILRKSYDLLRAENFGSKIFEMQSSGSTGEPTSVYIDNKINCDVFSTQLLFWSWGGFYMGAPHLQTGVSPSRGIVKKLKDLVFCCDYVCAFDISDKMLESIIKKLSQKHIKYLFGYASSIYLIAKHAYQKGIVLDKIFTWGDCLFPHYRELIEKSFSCKIIDCYGLGEGLQVACQCENHDALHIAEHNVHVEILDSKGDPVKGNEIGRVVVTRFEPGPMPLIRYDTGDIASFVPGECSCGRNLKLISRIQGRDTDIIQTPSGDRLIVHFFTKLFDSIKEVIQFQVRQEKLDEIKILYVPGSNFENGILINIREKIHSNCKCKLNIFFEPVENIPLESSNKRRFIISNCR